MHLVVYQINSPNVLNKKKHYLIFIVNVKIPTLLAQTFNIGNEVDKFSIL